MNIINVAYHVTELIKCTDLYRYKWENMGALCWNPEVTLEGDKVSADLFRRELSLQKDHLCRAPTGAHHRFDKSLAASNFPESREAS